MPTILSHTAVPLAFGLGLGRRHVPAPLLMAGALASVAPDLDVLAFRLGIPYANEFGHRGATHSLVFALLLGLLGAALASRLRVSRLTAFLFVGGSAASHGLLDMLTNGGLGVAFWWPLSQERHFLPWRVIEVSPLGMHRLITDKGLQVLQSELLWVWLPASVVYMTLCLWRLWYKPSLENASDGRLRRRQAVEHIGR